MADSESWQRLEPAGIINTSQPAQLAYFKHLQGFALCTLTWFASFQAREGGLSGPQEEKHGEQGSEGKWVWGQGSSAARPGLALPRGRAKGFKVMEQTLHSTRAPGGAVPVSGLGWGLENWHF